MTERISVLRGLWAFGAGVLLVAALEANVCAQPVHDVSIEQGPVEFVATHIATATQLPVGVTLQSRKFSALTDNDTRRARQDPDDCLMCHDDASLAMDRDGVDVSLFVDPKRYSESPHAAVDCIDCHVGFDPDEEPHQDPIRPVDCAPCHTAASASFGRGVHSRRTTCSTCHDNVHTRTGTVVSTNECRDCHASSFAAVAASVHVAEDSGPTCLSCHAPHRFLKASTKACVSCHGQDSFAAAHPEGNSVEAVREYEKSIHGDVIECSDCHTGHAVVAASSPESSVSRARVASVCATCHEGVAAEYANSEHSKALQAGFDAAPTCTDCHGEHDIESITNSASPVSRQNEIRVCESCHLNTPEVLARMTHSSAFVGAYARSVHGVAAAAGDEKAAICSDCHGAHQAMKTSAPGSMMNKFNISSTCGTCHEDIAAVFDESIHGVALEKGNFDAPTCTSCHSEHSIVKHTRSDSPVAAANVSEQVCSPCHNSFKLSSKYGFPSDRPASFGDSYHGLASRFGSAEAANCTSCHGVHDIWPSTDPRSRVYPANLTTTCGDCHPGANENFARGSVHVVRTPEGDRLLYWISAIYMLVIAVVVGGMGVHNMLDWGRKLRHRYDESVAPRAEKRAHGDRKPGLYVRMTLNERIQHATLAGSFTLLVITGFMLKFPDAWWVVWLRGLMGVKLFELRGVLHRVGAVIMVADSLYHIYYVAFTARGREFVRDIMFRGRDFADMWGMLRFNLGLDRTKPQFDRFSYIEKAEYWALIWGTIVMTLTGIVLWADNYFLSNFSKLFVDVNEVVHYYEAWLAFLAILVWHIYYVVFNPSVYPMNFTWLTGTVTEEEMEEEHPLELERLRKAEAGSRDDTP